MQVIREWSCDCFYLDIDKCQSEKRIVKYYVNLEQSSSVPSKCIHKNYQEARRCLLIYSAPTVCVVYNMYVYVHCTVSLVRFMLAVLMLYIVALITRKSNSWQFCIQGHVVSRAWSYELISRLIFFSLLERTSSLKAESRLRTCLHLCIYPFYMFMSDFIIIHIFHFRFNFIGYEWREK